MSEYPAVSSCDAAAPGRERRHPEAARPAYSSQATCECVDDALDVLQACDSRGALVSGLPDKRG